MVTLKDGSKLTYVKIAGMSSKEQDAIVEEISDEEADKLERHLRFIKNGIIRKKQATIKE